MATKIVKTMWMDNSVCAFEGCDNEPNDQYCCYRGCKGKWHHHGRVHYTHGRMYEESPERFRSGDWYLLCDHHYQELCKHDLKPEESWTWDSNELRQWPTRACPQR